MIIRGYIEPEELEYLVANKLDDLGIREHNYPFNPYEIISMEHIELKEIGLENDNIRGMIVHGNNCTGILINANRSYVSRRFIAMHELSHHWFHPHETQRVCFEKYKQTFHDLEWQANHAAAYALMPTKMVVDLYREYNGDLDCLCNILKVSPESLGYRMDEIGRANLEPRKYFYGMTTDNTLRNMESTWLYGGL